MKFARLSAVLAKPVEVGADVDDVARLALVGTEAKSDFAESEQRQIRTPVRLAPPSQRLSKSFLLNAYRLKRILTLNECSCDYCNFYIDAPLGVGRGIRRLQITPDGSLSSCSNRGLAFASCRLLSTDGNVPKPSNSSAFMILE